MLKIITWLNFDEDMQAEVRIGDALSESFSVKNGLCQGFTLASKLLNISLVLWCLPERLIALKLYFLALEGI